MVVAILAVLPGLIPAAVIIAVYSFLFKAITASDGGMVLELFAQILWGLVAGVFAISVTRYFFKRSNLNIVRIATLGFWGVGILFYVIILLSERGQSSEIFSSIANIVGLGIGVRVAPPNE